MAAFNIANLLQIPKPIRDDTGGFTLPGVPSREAFSLRDLMRSSDSTGGSGINVGRYTLPLSAQPMHEAFSQGSQYLPFQGNQVYEPATGQVFDTYEGGQYFPAKEWDGSPMYLKPGMYVPNAQGQWQPWLGPQTSSITKESPAPALATSASQGEGLTPSWLAPWGGTPGSALSGKISPSRAIADQRAAERDATIQRLGLYQDDEGNWLAPLPEGGSIPAEFLPEFKTYDEGPTRSILQDFMSLRGTDPDAVVIDGQNWRLATAGPDDPSFQWNPRVAQAAQSIRWHPDWGWVWPEAVTQNFGNLHQTGLDRFIEGAISSGPLTIPLAVAGGLGGLDALFGGTSGASAGLGEGVGTNAYFAGAPAAAGAGAPVAEAIPSWLAANAPLQDTTLMTGLGEPLGANAYFPELAAPSAPVPLPAPGLPSGLPVSPIPSVLTPPPPAPAPVPAPPAPPLDLQKLLLGGAVSGAGSALVGQTLGGEDTAPLTAPSEFDLATGAPRAGIAGGTAGLGLQVPPPGPVSDFELGLPISEFSLGGGPSGVGISGTATPSTDLDIAKAVATGAGSTAVGRIIDKLSGKGEAATSTATGRVIDQLLGKGDASASDWASVLGTLGTTGLSLIGSERQQDRLSDLYNIARTDRLPALTAFNQALTDPNTFYASAPAMGAVDAVLRRLSTQGNPAANPASLARAAAYNLGGYTDYLRGLSPAAFGTSGIEANLGSQLARNILDPYRAVATGLSELINPRARSNITLSDLLREAVIV